MAAVRAETFTEKYMKANRDEVRKAYVVTVHLIEARNLRLMSSNKTVSAFAEVNVCGRTRRTAIQRNTGNCLYDNIYVFNNLYLTKSEVERENIYIQVFNANIFTRNDLIGQYGFSLARVHRTKRDPFDATLYPHQIYQTWVAISNPEEPQLETGFILVSITVLGEGDIPPSHTEEKLDLDEKSFKVTMAPHIKRRGYELEFNCYRGEDLPAMDFITGSADPFMVLKFNGVTIRSDTAKDTLRPEWNQRITIPVYTPCMANNIDIQLWDWSRLNPDELVATRQLQFSKLLTQPFGPLWVNFYGAPVNQSGFWGWLGEVTPNLTSDIERDDTAYLGRVLLSLKAKIKPAPKAGDVQIPALNLAKQQWYALRMDLYEGSDMPVSFWGSKVMVECCFGPPKNSRQSNWCDVDRTGRVKFTLNPKSTSAVRVPRSDLPAEKRDWCQFEQVMVQFPVMVPSSSEQVKAQAYHVIINVYVKKGLGPASRIGYLRINPFDCWTTRWNAKPEWKMLRGISDNEGYSVVSPGFLLFSLSFGAEPTVSQVERFTTRSHMIDWRKECNKYQLRAHVYQARDLVAAGDVGLTNSFVEVSVAGRYSVQPPNEEDVETAEAREEQEAQKIANDAKPAKMAQRWKYRTDGSEKGADKSGIPDDRAPTPEEQAAVQRTHCVSNTLNPMYYETLVVDTVWLPDMSLFGERSDGQQRKAQQTYVQGLAEMIQISVYHQKSGKPTAVERLFGRKRFHEIGRAYIAPFRCTRKRWADSTNAKSLMDPIWLRLQGPGLRQDPHAERGFIQIKLDLVLCDPQGPKKMPELRRPFKQFMRCRLTMLVAKLIDMPEHGIWGVKDPYIAISCLPPQDKKLWDMDQEYKTIKGVNEPAVQHKPRKPDEASTFGNLIESSRLKTSGPMQVYSPFNKRMYGRGAHPIVNDKVTIDVMCHRSDPNQAPTLTVMVFEGKPVKGDLRSANLVGTASVPLHLLSLQLREYASNSKFVSYDRLAAELERQTPLFLPDDKPQHKSDVTDTRKVNDEVLVLEIGDLNTRAGLEGLELGGCVEDGQIEETNATYAALQRKCEQDEMDKQFTGGQRDGKAVQWPTEQQTEENEQVRLQFMVRNELEDDDLFLEPHRAWPKKPKIPPSRLWFRRIDLYRGRTDKQSSAVARFFGARRIPRRRYSGALKAAFYIRRCGKALTEEIVRPRQHLETIVGQTNACKMSKPVLVNVRVYIRKGHGLLPSRYGGSTLNPYVRVYLRGVKCNLDMGPLVTRLNDTVGVRPNTLDPDFFKLYQLDAQCPNLSELKIDIMHRGGISDSLVGSTSIDLNDRWYNRTWQKMVKDKKVPVEFRTLTNPSCTLPQGKLELWVEMYPKQDAEDVPFVPIQLQKPGNWELRAVIWDCEKVIQPEAGGVLDIFFTVEYQCSDTDKSENIFPTTRVQDTPPYFKAKGGVGEFNWRFKYMVRIPSKYPRLKIKAWDKRNLFPNQYIAEANLDLHVIFQRAGMTQKRQDREKAYISLSHPVNGNKMGRVAMQLSLVTQKYMEKFPVGYGNNEPNRDPFLPAVDQSLGRGNPSIPTWLICLVLIILVVVAVVGTR